MVRTRSSSAGLTSQPSLVARLENVARETCAGYPTKEVCGFYRFAHIDGRIATNPAQYVRRPKVQPTDARGLDRAELGAFLFTAERFDAAHAALAALLGLNGLRASEGCSADIENLGFERGHRTLRIVGKGNRPAVIPVVPRTARTIDLAIGERTSGPILYARTASASTGGRRMAG